MLIFGFDEIFDEPNGMSTKWLQQFTFWQCRSLFYFWTVFSLIWKFIVVPFSISNFRLLSLLLFPFSVLQNCTGASISSLEATIHSFPTNSIQSRCSDVSGLWTPCICSLEMCIGWYPCGLKFCKGKTDINGNGIDNNASYRCGIKTCRKCNQFTYYVHQKQQCLWDDWPTMTTRRNNEDMNKKWRE